MVVVVGQYRIELRGVRGVPREEGEEEESGQASGDHGWEEAGIEWIGLRHRGVVAMRIRGAR